MTRRCLYCYLPVPRRGSRGRFPSYCSNAHRQRSYEIRKRLKELRTSDRIQAWLHGIRAGAA